MLGFFLFLIIGLGNEQSTGLFKSQLDRRQFIQVRIVENLCCSLLILPALIFSGNYLIALAAVLSGLILGTITFPTPRSFKLPSPFRKIPFEASQGFRRYFWILAFLLFIWVRALQVGNLNLALVCQGFMTFIIMGFYTRPESPYFVWIFDKSPKSFLLFKIKQSIVLWSGFLLPVSLIDVLIFPAQAIWIIGIGLLSLLFMVSSVLAKYAAFPNQISVPETVLYALSLFFPPLLLLVMNEFYTKARRGLLRYLS